MISQLKLRFSACALVSSMIASATHAGFTDLGGNWRAEWDDSLDALVNVIALGVTPSPNGDVISIRKEAEFTQPSVNGQFPAIAITFRQLGVSNVEYIVVDDEIVTNSTGEAWGDFHIQLLDSGDALFDAALTAGSGGPGPIGWDVSPFTNAVFTTTTDLDISGGLIPDGGVWTPGSGDNGGNLWIDVVSGGVGDFTLFTLKETPSIPGPASIALMGFAAIFTIRARRRM